MRSRLALARAGGIQHPAGQAPHEPRPLRCGGGLEFGIGKHSVEARRAVRLIPVPGDAAEGADGASAISAPGGLGAVAAGTAEAAGAGPSAGGGFFLKKLNMWSER